MFQAVLTLNTIVSHLNVGTIYCFTGFLVFFFQEVRQEKEEVILLYRPSALSHFDTWSPEYCLY